MQVRVPSAARNFSPRVNFQHRLSYGVHTAPVCNCLHNICAHVKNPKHCLDTWRYCTHSQEWVALLLWVLCFTRVRWPKFPASDKEVLNKQKIKKAQDLLWHQVLVSQQVLGFLLFFSWCSSNNNAPSPSCVGSRTLQALLQEYTYCYPHVANQECHLPLQ